MDNETWFVQFSHLHVTQIMQQKNEHINTHIYNIEHTTDTQRHFQMHTYTQKHIQTHIQHIFSTYTAHIQHIYNTPHIHTKYTLYHSFSILILDGTKDLPYLAVRHLIDRSLFPDLSFSYLKFKGWLLSFWITSHLILTLFQYSSLRD